ncbi:MAG: hypothetical protein M5U26_29025 [Planctomycetota bacterium]|nr:hypothetical protein [Planctomycetota bacterium]
MPRAKKPKPTDCPAEVCAHLQPLLARARESGCRVEYRRWDRTNRRYSVVFEEGAKPDAALGDQPLPKGLETLDPMAFIVLNCAPCRHQLCFPRPPEVPEFDAAELTPALRAVYCFELERGNRPRIVCRTWTKCPLAVTLDKPLEFEALGGLAKGLERCESWDSHYDLEEGFQDPASRQILSGPPPIFDRLREVLQPLVKRLVAGEFEALAALGPGLTPEALARAVKRCKERLIEVPNAAFRAPRGHGVESLTVHPVPGIRPPAYVFCLDLWSAESTRFGLYLVGSVTARAASLDLKLDYLGNDPLPAIEEAQARFAP